MVFTIHVDDILGCGEKGVTQEVHVCLTRRPGALKLQATDFNHVGSVVAQQRDFAAALARKVSAGELELLPTSAELRNQRQSLLDPSEIRDCQW